MSIQCYYELARKVTALILSFKTFNYFKEITHFELLGTPKSVDCLSSLFMLHSIFSFLSFRPLHVEVRIKENTDFKWFKVHIGRK